MPSQKKWVVDKTGFHAVTEFAPADKTTVYVDDTYNTQTDNTESSDDREVQLLEGKWLPGEDGFQFNKKCKVQVKAKFLKETSRRKVTLSTFVEYEGEEEDLGQQVELELNDDGIAEGEIMLYYGEKYNKALQEKPDAKCYYLFKATHSTAKSELESEKLEMPQSQEEQVNLKKGNYDDKGVESYSTKKVDSEGYVKGFKVKELQENLEKVGVKNVGKIDGDFGDKTEKAVVAFQKAAEEKSRMKKDNTIIEVEEVLSDHKEGVFDKKTTDEIEKWLSDELKIPVSEYYGGYVLQSGDNDKSKTWGGQKCEEEGEYVKELQEDLLKLGYWISTPDSNVGKGRSVDGYFQGGTKKAVKTFQLEHFGFTSEGSIDESETGKITGVVDSETAEKIKEAVNNCGSSTWYRPGHNATKTWERRERLPTGAWGAWEQMSGSYGTFLQVPPSNGYCRQSVNYGSNELFTNTKSNYEERSSSLEVLENDSCTFVMADCWGTEQMISFIKSVGDEWALKKAQNQQVPIFRVADISGFNGGPLSPHAGHQDGAAVDLNDIVCSCRDFSEEWHRECSLELAKLLHEKGAVRILFNCHYIIKNVPIAQQCISHHHHFHVDGLGSDESPLAERYTTCHNCGIFNNCSKKITQVRLNADSPWQDYDRNAAKGSQNGLYATGGARTEGCVLLGNAKDS